MTIFDMCAYLLINYTREPLLKCRQVQSKYQTTTHLKIVTKGVQRNLPLHLIVDFALPNIYYNTEYSVLAEELVKKFTSLPRLALEQISSCIVTVHDVVNDSQNGYRILAT